MKRADLARVAHLSAVGLQLPPGICAAVIVTDESGAYVGVGYTCETDYGDAMIWCAAHGEDRVNHVLETLLGQPMVRTAAGLVQVEPYYVVRERGQWLLLSNDPMGSAEVCAIQDDDATEELADALVCLANQIRRAVQESRR